jgi:hypothetical protein
MDYKCNKCGAGAMVDTRGGSVDVVLMCRCDTKGEWIDDGRGGYYNNDAKPIPDGGDGGSISDPSWHGYDNR